MRLCGVSLLSTKLAFTELFPLWCLESHASDHGGDLEMSIRYFRCQWTRRGVF